MSLFLMKQEMEKVLGWCLGNQILVELAMPQKLDHHVGVGVACDHQSLGKQLSPNSSCWPVLIQLGQRHGALLITAHTGLVGLDPIP